MSEEHTNQEAPAVGQLKPGAAITGTIKSVELYGAFVDIGVGRDALLHISQLGKPNVRNVEDVVKVGESVTVYVLKVEPETGRVALSLVKPPDVTWETLEVGQLHTGTVTRVEKFGVFVDIGAERPGMVHVSELADGFVKSPSDVVSVGQEVEVRIIKVNRKKRQIDMSMKSAPQITETVVEEDDEEVPTAMALAFRKAMEQQEDSETPEQAAASKKKQKRAEQDDIIARTLRQHS